MKQPTYSWSAIRSKAAALLLEGISPRRLALTLALGFVLGCIPLIGIPTGLCALLAIVFRLNLPAIQVANYVAMPFQLALLMPLVRLGGKVAPFAHASLDLAALTHSPLQLLSHASVQLAFLAGQALLGWLVLAIPAAALLTLGLTGVLRRVPAIASPRN